MSCVTVVTSDFPVWFIIGSFSLDWQLIIYYMYFVTAEK